jgi:hypothetical protein
MPTIVLQFFYSKEELAQHGDEFYESHVHHQVEEGNHDKNFAITLFALESLRLVSVRGVEEIALKPPISTGWNAIALCVSLLSLFASIAKAFSINERVILA